MAASDKGPAKEVRLATMNLAHARGRGAHQLVTRRQVLRANLEGIARWVVEADADIACMQEADAPSWWSGRFDHVAALAGDAGHDYRTHARNVDGLGLRYGTAISSRLPLYDAHSHTFAPTPPTFRKGLAVSAMRWPGDPDFEFDVVSIHTDFARRSTRARQIHELAEVVRRRGRPVIVAGDFNSDWRANGAVRQATQLLGLSAFDPTGHMVTFPTTRGRLDWVLASPEFEIVDVTASEWTLSDHRPLLARIRRAR